MMDPFEIRLSELESESRLRVIPSDIDSELLDFCSNDYLGLSQISSCCSHIPDMPKTSSASRLLASRQREYENLEIQLGRLYSKSVLLFNSGYHANAGAISSMGIPEVLLVADKLAHASMIDGLTLSRSRFERFRHNDINHLEEIIRKFECEYKKIVVITESIFSMDGDIAPLHQLVNLKSKYPSVLLYVDEAHAFGVRGKRGLGLAEERGLVDDIDIIVGTFGKAAASMGAFVACSSKMRDFFLNFARSFIFSTALPPSVISHSLEMVMQIENAEDKRTQLAVISDFFRSEIERITGVPNPSRSQIVPLIIGDPDLAMKFSEMLLLDGFLARAIRRPSVPKGTERIRFSLSASHSLKDIKRLLDSINRIYGEIIKRS